jgi:hypothetical protein
VGEARDGIGGRGQGWDIQAGEARDGIGEGRPGME